MRKEIHFAWLFIVFLLLPLAVKPCSCFPPNDWSFCEQSSYGYLRIKGIPIYKDSISAHIQVLETWSNHIVGDTIIVWDDSLTVVSFSMTPGVYDYDCAFDTKTRFDIGDTILLLAKPNFGGFGDTTDWMFTMDFCLTDVLVVQNDSIQELIGIPYLTYRTLKVSVAELKDIIDQGLECFDFAVGIDQVNAILPSVVIDNGVIQIRNLEQLGCTLRIFDSTGRTTQTIASNRLSMETALPATGGVYFIQLCKGNNCITRRIAVYP